MRMHLFGTMAITALLAGSAVPTAAFPLNNNPIAVNDSETIQCEAIYAFDPLSNDYDPDGDTLTIIDAQTNFGSVQIEGGGTSLSFDSATPGSAAILYTISDGNGGQAQATISVTINGRRPVC